MRRTKPISEEAAAKRNHLLSEVRSADGLRRVQCLWLQTALGLSITQIAAAIGWDETKVRKNTHKIF